MTAIQPQVSDTYHRIQKTMAAIVSRCDLWVTSMGAPIAVTMITADILPTMRDWSAAIPDSGAFPQQWIDKLDAYAASQVATPPEDWKSYYDGVQTKIGPAIAAIVAEIPTENGKAAFSTFSADGTETVDTVTVTQATIDALTALRDAV